jgi:hypothetical protein
MAAQRNAPIWLKVFVWFHVIAITIKCLPSAPSDAVGPQARRSLFGSEYLLAFNDKIKGYTEVYMWPTGIWQSWDMFAPNPSDWEGYVTADITYKDGTVKKYTYPRMYELGLGIKYFKERYRKFLERAHHKNHAWIRPRFALRIAVKNYTDPNNPPVKVELHRHEAIVPPNMPFGTYLSNLWKATTEGKLSGSLLLPENPKMPPYRDEMYFPYIVPERELKELAGI